MAQEQAASPPTPEPSAVKPLRTTHPAVRRWLMWMAAFVYIMVLIGGLTRLTDSGLSITEWQPLLGALPPMNEADWSALFEKYKQTTEFKVQNSWMQLSDFKPIFWWEWGHRQFGRLLALVYVLPLLYFLLRGRISAKLLPWLLLLFVLGGAQGALGWYMVQSGLDGRTDVSQYRLAAHLLLAAALFAAVFWTAIGIGWKRSGPKTLHQLFALLLVVLVLVQITLGGLVAGLDAGNVSTTWPKMDGAWVPDGLWIIKPEWRNIFDNALTVQFSHRTLAYLIFGLAVIHALWAFNASAMIIAYAVFTQILLGVMTVIMRVPMGVAIVHQATALVVLAVAVWNLHRQCVIHRIEEAAPEEQPQKIQDRITPKLVPDPR